MSDWCCSLIVSFSFIALGVFAKAIVNGMCWRDWYLGLEMCLTGTCGAILALLNIIDRFKNATNKVADKEHFDNQVQVLSDTIRWEIAYIAVSLVIYFVVLFIHKAWEKEEHSKVKQRIVLIGAANLIGMVNLFIFIRAFHG